MIKQVQPVVTKGASKALTLQHRIDELVVSSGEVSMSIRKDMAQTASQLNAVDTQMESITSFNMTFK